MTVMEIDQGSRAATTAPPVAPGARAHAAALAQFDAAAAHLDLDDGVRAFLRDRKS
jgi:hypothetical protein